MVEYSLDLNAVFGSLADSIRRDILERLRRSPLSMGEIAKNYSMSFAAISKHIKVLEKACLITKRRRGNEHIVQLAPQALADIDHYLAQYRQFWEGRFQVLDTVLEQEMSQRNQERHIS